MIDRGQSIFPATLEVKKAAALDPRTVVDTKSQLIDGDKWPHDGSDDNIIYYVYKGMLVTVADSGKMYMLNDVSKLLESDYSGWTEVTGIDENHINDLISDAISGISKFDYEIVDKLPTTGTKGIIYLVLSGTNNDSYDEYIWINNSFERLGPSGINMDPITDEEIANIINPPVSE